MFSDSWAGSVAQVVEHLVNKHQALGSNPNNTRRKKW
jgi:hypothetical protein